jgi:streptomycin 6-kinase
VAPVRDAAGHEAVLKVGWTHTEARDEAEGLAVFGGEGAVQVYAFEHTGPTTAILLERCRPGYELRIRPEREQHEVITALLRRLWRVPLPTGHRFRPLTVMCDEWADRSAAAHAARPGILDPGLIRAGLRLFRTLPRQASRSALLCTDLHVGNVLAGTRRPWLLIDPKPYVGDPHYDVLQHLLNCTESLQKDPRGLVHQVAQFAALDADRAEQWLFARCVQDSPDWPALALVAQRLSP